MSISSCFRDIVL